MQVTIKQKLVFHMYEFMKGRWNCINFFHQSSWEPVLQSEFVLEEIQFVLEEIQF